MAKASSAVVPSVARQAVLAGAKADGFSVAIRPAEPAIRIVLRAPASSVPSLSKALNIDLPTQPKTSATAKGGGILRTRAPVGSRAALWLGPDEWLVIDFRGADLAAELQKVKAFHAAVDVSHRNTAIIVAGSGAAATLNAGCPQDLSPAAFPVGSASRTVLGKIEIVLWRTEEHVFRVECWRSFADYALALLTAAARDA